MPKNNSFAEIRSDLQDLKSDRFQDRAIQNLAGLLAGYERRIDELEKRIEELEGLVGIR